MATRIRLQRHGKKNQPYYHIVITDGRAPRDGRFIEKIGTYNTLTHPATINIDFDRALYWVETGASPSETVLSILKHEGVYLMKHLRGGIAKGAITEIDAEKKFGAWKQEKESKVSNVKRDAADKTREDKKKRLEAETKLRESIAKKVAAKYAVEVAKEAKTDTKAEEAVEEVAEVTEVAEVIVSAEETSVVAEETTVAEVTDEPAAEEPSVETPAE
ncbi:MAG: 30S ribosomal protein S16 [Bacteroidales bacterium]|jgi:small subunit ribosomal protein S16|nr:30S ribosomal protein S16 [Bacteroidales bacterium]